MKFHQDKRLILVLASALITILLSTAALAQTDMNINNSNMIRFGGDVIVPAKQVVENAHAIGGDVTIQPGARVTQTAIAIDGDVILEPGSRVDGDAYAVGGEVITAQGATIGGTSRAVIENGRWGTHHPRRRGSDNFAVRYLFSTVFHILNVLGATFIGAALLLWRPNLLQSLATTIRQHPLQCGLWGLGGLAAVILLIILLAVSLIGIPLLPLVGVIVTVAVILGSLGVALWVGQRTATSSERKPMQQFLMGMLILGLIGLLPVLGGLVLSVVNILGFGAVLTWLLTKRSLSPLSPTDSTC